MLRVTRLRGRINELAKALVYRSEAPMHLPALLLPFYHTWRDLDPKPMPRAIRRCIMAYFAWHGHHVSIAHFDVAHDDYGPLVGVEGVLYPLRPQGCPMRRQWSSFVTVTRSRRRSRQPRCSTDADPRVQPADASAKHQRG